MVFRISNTAYISEGTQGILDRQLELNSIQRQMSTLKKINTPSDDPINNGVIFDLQETQNRIEQYQNNIAWASNQLSLQEIQLRSLTTSSLLRMQELSISALNGARTQQDRFVIAQEMRQHLDQMLSIANSRGMGSEYLFAGSKTDTIPVIVDANGVYHYQGDETIQNMPIGPSAQIATNNTGRALFFNIPSTGVVLTQGTGLSQLNSTPSALVAAGTLPVLSAGQLRINHVGIPVPSPDSISTTDNTASAKALVTAINSKQFEHGVLAKLNPNTFVLNPTVYGNLVNGDLTLNGFAITGNIAVEADLINAINAQSSQTGVVASDAAGNVLLTAEDGRNIHLQTSGTVASLANFSNFNLQGGVALNEVQQGSFTLLDDHPIVISGTLPTQAGLSLGTTPLVANTGNALWRSASMVGVGENDPAPPRDEIFWIVIEASNQYSVYSSKTPNAPLSDYAHLSYTPGQDINVTVQGVNMVLSGTPNVGDQFFLDITPQEHQDLFNGMAKLISHIEQGGGGQDYPYQFAYQIGVGLSNLTEALDHLNVMVADVGSKLNNIDIQKENNAQLIFITQETISQIQDLDVVDAIRRLSLATTAMEAAQKSFVSIQGFSLFKYL